MRPGPRAGNGRGRGHRGLGLPAGTSEQQTVQARVFGLIAHTHAPVAKFFDDRVVRDGLADHDLANSQSCNGRRDMEASQ
jgi:hypothetical protein